MGDGGGGGETAGFGGGMGEEGRKVVRRSDGDGGGQVNWAEDLAMEFTKRLKKREKREKVEREKRNVQAKLNTAASILFPIIC